MKNFLLILLVCLAGYLGYYYIEHRTLPFELWTLAGQEASDDGATPSPHPITKTPSPAPMPAATIHTYSSDHTGVTFWYSTEYFLRERNAGTSSRPQYALVLMEDTQENRDLVEGKSATPREGPTNITVDVYQNPKKLSVSEWAREDTNWNLGSKKTADATVGGKEGVSFTWDGLYAGKSTVVVSGEKAYVFAVTFMGQNDPIVKEYDALLKSVVFGD